MQIHVDKILTSSWIFWDRTYADCVKSHEVETWKTGFLTGEFATHEAE